MSTKRGQKRAEEPLDPNAWMNTFCDLLLLMLTFFVLLLTMSSLDAQKLAAVTRPGTLLKDSGGGESSARDIARLGPERVIAVKIRPPQRASSAQAGRAQQGERVERALEQTMTDLNLAQSGWITRRVGSVSVNLDASVMFAPGSTTLTEQALTYLKEISALLKTQKQARLRVEVWQEGGRERLIEQERALDLAMRRGERLTETLKRFGTAEQRLELGAYESSAGAREGRLLRQPKLIALTLLF